jgi:hypothetical protein
VNSTTRAILQTVAATDSSLSDDEKAAVQQLVDGKLEALSLGSSNHKHLLVTQKRAAELLSVNRVTIWRMTKEALLHPVELLPGTWRYPMDEILGLVNEGIAPSVAPLVNGAGSRATAA